MVCIGIDILDIWSRKVSRDRFYLLVREVGVYIFPDLISPNYGFNMKLAMSPLVWVTKLEIPPLPR
jgi:hypothetical protein